MWVLPSHYQQISLLHAKLLIRALFLTALAVLSLFADSVKVTTLACPTPKLLKSIERSVDMSDSMQIERYAIAHSCKVLDRQSKIRVIDYPKNIHATMLKVQLLQSGELLYTYSKNLAIEHSEDKNIMKF